MIDAPEQPGRLVQFLSHPRTWALATVVAFFTLVLTLYIGFLQFRLSNCLAEYNDLTAAVTAARAQAAEQERHLERVEDDAEYRAEEALDATLAAMAAQDETRVREVFADMLRVRSEVAEVRHDIAEQRAALEQQRRDHPAPAPPEQRCG